MRLALAIAFTAGVVAIVGGVGLYEYRHPCIRHEEQICDALICTYYDQDAICQAWMTEQQPCIVCVERKER